MLSFFTGCLFCSAGCDFLGIICPLTPTELFRLHRCLYPRTFCCTFGSRRGAFASQVSVVKVGATDISAPSKFTLNGHSACRCQRFSDCVYSYPFLGVILPKILGVLISPVFVFLVCGTNIFPSHLTFGSALRLLAFILFSFASLRLGSVCRRSLRQVFSFVQLLDEVQGVLQLEQKGIQALFPKKAWQSQGYWRRVECYFR